MVGHVELVFLSDSLPQGDQFPGRKLDDTATLTAHQVVVRFFTENPLIMQLFYIKPDLLENIALDKQRQRSIDGGFAYIQSPILQCIKQLFRLEVFVDIKYDVKNVLPGLGKLDAILAEVYAECLEGLCMHNVLFVGMGHR
jgi:hypothetical protein